MSEWREKFYSKFINDYIGDSVDTDMKFVSLFDSEFLKLVEPIEKELGETGFYDRSRIGDNIFQYSIGFSKISIEIENASFIKMFIYHNKNLDIANDRFHFTKQENGFTDHNNDLFSVKYIDKIFRRAFYHNGVSILT